MHEIRFKMTLQSRIVEYAALYEYASMPRRAILYGRLFLFVASGFVLTLYILLALYHEFRSANWPFLPWPPRPFPFFLSVAWGLFFGSIWVAASNNARSIRLFPEHVVWNRRNAIGWQDVTATLNDGQYIQICCPSIAVAIVVPKSAFSTMQEAEAFYQTAFTYWHEANGIKPLVSDTASVWPPAPRPGA